jgi:hypothetical protein
MILVSIVGDFITNVTPVIFEFREKITKHILVYDDAQYEARKVERVREAIDYINARYGLAIEQYESQIDEDSKADIDGVTEELFGFAEDSHDLYLNATGGPANIAIFLSAAILNRGGKAIVYDNMDNTYNLIYGTNMRTISLGQKMGVKDYCHMMGMKILDYRRKKDIKRNKKQVVHLFRSYGSLNKVRRALSSGNKRFPYRQYQPIMDELRALGVVDKKHNLLDRNYLYGGMFEEYIFFLVKKLDFDDIMINVIVEMDHLGGASVKNEFDILMMKDNHPYIIECKHKRNLNGDNIVYKYDAISDDIGPDSKVMIVNISDKPKIKYKNRNISSSFSRGNINRALLNNIDIYHEARINEKKFLKRVRRFFGVSFKAKAQPVGKKMKQRAGDAALVDTPEVPGR